MRDLVRSKRNKEYCVQVPANVYLPDPQAILEAETPCELETRYDPLGLGLVPKCLDHETLYSKDEKHRKQYFAHTVTPHWTGKSLAVERERIHDKFYEVCPSN